MDELTARRAVRRNLGRIGWAIFVYFISAQLIASLFLLIPGVMDNIYLTMLANDLAIYVLAPVLLWLMLRSLPKGRSAAQTLTPRAVLRTAIYAMGIGYLFNYATSLIILGIEALTGTSTGNVLELQLGEMPLWLSILTVGIIAPVCEELIFRKLLLDRLRPYGDRCAIWVSALAFGLFHMNLYQILYATALGLIFAGVALKTGKVRHVILFHAIINNFSLLLTQLLTLFDPESTAGTVFSVLMGVVMLALIGLAIYFFVRYAKTFRHAPPQYPLPTKAVMQTLLRCPGMWVSALLSLGMGVMIIFVA